MTQIICGINAVNETLRQGKGIVELLVARGRKIARMKEILDLARARDIPIRFKDRVYLDRVSPDTSHQGVVAVLGNYTYCTVDTLMEMALSQKSKGLLVVADHIIDPGNLGSLVRTAEFFGVHGLIIPKDRSASITDIVHKRSAGGTAPLIGDERDPLSEGTREEALPADPGSLSSPMSGAAFTGDIVIRVDLVPLSKGVTSIPFTYAHLGFNTGNILANDPDASLQGYT